MPIPPLVHQTWKTARTPLRWRHLVQTVKQHHPGWTYRLWSDQEMDAHVRASHPALHPVYAAFEKNVMRADVFRYVVMHDLGGLYCDLDYEFLRPYPYGDAELVLMEEFSPQAGDSDLQIANYVFASATGHLFWKDVLDDLVRNPPVVTTAGDVTGATGPGLLSRIFLAGAERYPDVVVAPKQAFSPVRMRGRNESTSLIGSGAYGVHHAWGSWKERTGAHYIRKAARLLDR
ncbi:MAG: glycosyltransferase [Hyphomicrobiales bacterium]|nr:glycosyltransferase [Hyphomicrobiales bacterium]